MTRRVAGTAAAALAVAVAAGCGGGSNAAPKEDPGAVMKSVVKHELNGDRATTYAMLVREQRKLIDRTLYTKCSPGPEPGARVTVGIVGVHDQQFEVPALGKTKTKAVSYEIKFNDGTSPIASIGHLIAQEGHWRWTLSAASFNSLSGGNCP